MNWCWKCRRTTRIRSPELVREEMEGVESLDVPLIVDIGSGSSWFEAKT